MAYNSVVPTLVEARAKLCVSKPRPSLRLLLQLPCLPAPRMEAVGQYQILPRQLVNGGRLSGNGVEKLENATRRSIKHIASFLRGSWKAVHEEEDEEDERERRRFEDIDR